MNTENTEEKTESPTPHKIKKAEKFGNTQNSYEINFFLILFSNIIFLWFWKFNFYNFVICFLRFCFSFQILHLYNKSFYLIFYMYCKKIIFFFLFFYINIFLICLMVPWIIYKKKKLFFPIFFQTNFLNNCFNIQKIFSLNTFVVSLKYFLQIFFIIIFSFNNFIKYYPNIYIWFSYSFKKNVSLGSNFIFFCSIINIFIYCFFVIIDFFWKKFEYVKSLNMTKKEIKDEFKELESNQLMKSYIRRTSLSNSKNFLLNEFIKSDILICESLNYAISFQYNINTMQAPRVISKGKGYSILHMKKYAKLYKIPILESNMSLKSLYDSTSIGYNIPVTFFKIIAEIFAWILQFKKWKKKGGKFPELPKNFILLKE